MIITETFNEKDYAQVLLLERDNYISIINVSHNSVKESVVTFRFMQPYIEESIKNHILKFIY